MKMMALSTKIKVRRVNCIKGARTIAENFFRASSFLDLLHHLHAYASGVTLPPIFVGRLWQTPTVEAAFHRKVLQ